jgi:hypothetical protein
MHTAPTTFTSFKSLPPRAREAVYSKNKLDFAFQGCLYVMEATKFSDDVLVVVTMLAPKIQAAGVFTCKL